MFDNEKQYKDLLAEIVKGYELPEGYDEWGIRSVRPDFRSSRGFRWPFPGQVAVAPGPINRSNTDGCPSREVEDGTRTRGDGICLAKTWRGMASGGIPALTLLLVAYASSSVLGHTESEQKYRVERCFVVDVIDGARLVREHGCSANLYGADLLGANLHGADLHGANLLGADLHGADLHGADLHGADLYGADLRGADLHGADLHGADLRSADLRGATADEYTRTPNGFTVRDGRIVRECGR